MNSKKKQIEYLQFEINNLKEELKRKQEQLNELINDLNETSGTPNALTGSEISRYSRQMIMPNITRNGQAALKNSKVLIVGMGGLGCPAALYLVAAGVGEINIVDSDEVETSNLHRQILHTEVDIGIPKVKSAFNTLRSMNSNVKILPIQMHINSSTIKVLVEENQYDVIIDGTDNVPTRYLLNDISVFYGIPLVSGSALQMEGQLTVYNYNGSPCYRCMFPVPPPPETVTSCGDGGVLGPVPGTIGVLQALETIKIIVGMEGVLAGRLLLFDGSEGIFRNINLRRKKENCNVCGRCPKILDLVDYELFCRAKANDKVQDIRILKPDEEITVKELFKNRNGVLLDVRPELEYLMCSLPNTINIPYTDLVRNRGFNILTDEIDKLHADRVYILCRRGNDSQRATCHLKNTFVNMKFINVLGGLHAYSKEVDRSFPVY